MNVRHIATALIVLVHVASGAIPVSLTRGIQPDSDVDFYRDLVAGSDLHAKNAPSAHGISATSSQIDSNLNAHVAGSFQEVIATVNSHHQL